MTRHIITLAAALLLTACQTAPTKEGDDAQYIREGEVEVVQVEGDITRSTGGSEVIVIELEPAEDGAAPATFGDLVNKGRQELIMREMAETQQKMGIRTADCNDRAQFASAVVQMRDQGIDLPTIRSTFAEVWPKTNAAFKEAHGVDLPHWYKLEMERIITVMERDEPTDFKEFAQWFMVQCVKFGPWLHPNAQ